MVQHGDHRMAQLGSIHSSLDLVEACQSVRCCGRLHLQLRHPFESGQKAGEVRSWQRWGRFDRCSC